VPVTEPPDPSQYGRSFADVYDDWYADSFDTDGAVAALQELAGRGPVLELGVGTGRLAVPLARRGLRVVGVDASVEMIERLRRSADGGSLDAIVGDMELTCEVVAAAGHHVPFSLVFCAFNTILNLPSEAAVTRCLRGSRQVLADDGLVVIEAVVPVEESLIPDRSLTPARVTSSSVVFVETTYDRSARRIVGRHVEILDRTVTVRPWSVLMLTTAQLDRAATSAGLMLHDRWSDWSATPFDDRSSTHVSIYGIDASAPTRGSVR
jgi:SAM-dependent methyltransferase